MRRIALQFFEIYSSGASHLAWTNLSKSYQPVILDYALAFFDCSLKGETHPDPLTNLRKHPWLKGVSEMRSDLK